MDSLFDKQTYEVIIQRIDQLTPTQTAQWGKMDVAQMLAHCKEAFKVPLSDKKIPGSFIGKIIGGLMKAKLYNDSPWGKNLPTSPQFIIKDSRNFDEEKTQLKNLVTVFYTAGPETAGKFPHPFFGKLTPEQWGKGMYKHLDHHLRQFAV